MKLLTSLSIIFAFNFSNANNEKSIEECLQSCRSADFFNCIPLGSGFPDLDKFLNELTHLQTRPMAVTENNCNKSISATAGIISSSTGECLIKTSSKPDIFYPNNISGIINVRNDIINILFPNSLSSPQYIYDWGRFTFNQILRAANLFVWLTYEERSNTSNIKCWSRGL